MGWYKTSQVLLLSLASGTGAALLAYWAWNQWVQGYWLVALGLGCLFCLLTTLSVLLLDCARSRPADSHVLTTLVYQYLFILVVRIYGCYIHNKLKGMLAFCKQEQDKVLQAILRDNANTEYGQLHKFTSIKTREDYINKLPITAYDHYVDYISRMATNGEENLLTHHKVTFFALTSGTTGKNKMYPLAPIHSRKMIPHFAAVCYNIQHLIKLHRHFSFRLYPRRRQTPTGIPMGGVSMAVGGPQPYNITPTSFTNLTQEKPAIYTQALFALKEKEVGSLDCISSNLLLSFFKLIETHSQELCDDIESGDINTGVGIPENIRQQLKTSLTPDYNRALFLRQEMAKGPEGFAKRIWPRFTYAICISTGGFSLCANILRSSYLKGVQLVGAGHGATESGVIGYPDPLGPPDGPVNIFASNYDFLEFIPLEEVEYESPKTLFMDQLLVGESYEVVVTNCLGLYRFRLGDVIKVVDYRSSTPMYEFQYRLGQRLSITFERTPESVLQATLARCESGWQGVMVVDFTACESFVLENITGQSSQQSNYVVFTEVTHEGSPYILTESQTAQLDDILCQLHEPYDTYRQKGAIAQLQVIHVQPGSFDGLKHLLWGDYQNMQFKMPRVERREPLVKYLLDQRVSQPCQCVLSKTCRCRVWN